MTTILKTIGLVAALLLLVIAVALLIFWLLDTATRPDDQIMLYWPVKPGYVEVPR